MKPLQQRARWKTSRFQTLLGGGTKKPNALVETTRGIRKQMWAAPNAPIRPTALVAFVMADNKEQGLQRIGEVDEDELYY